MRIKSKKEYPHLYSLGYTAKKVAETLGVSPFNFYRWKHYHSIMSLLERIASTRVSIDEIATVLLSVRPIQSLEETEEKA
jgi:hypothetical protein